MPVFRSGESAAWCEMEYFEIVTIAANAERTLEWRGPKEKVIVVRGEGRVVLGERSFPVKVGANLDVDAAEGTIRVVDITDDITLVRFCGWWGDAVGGSGLFVVVASESPTDNGDPVTYPKQTRFDRHYHDCDEYWVIYEGQGTAVTEGKACAVGPGDCVATGMGHHHDFPLVATPIKAVYFETTLEGRKRLGHLWEHTHGRAKPKPERV